MLRERKSSTAVWAGDFTVAASDEYFRENYGDDDAPISPFARDLGVRFYDHDWLEVLRSPDGRLRNAGELLKSDASGGDELASLLGARAGTPCLLVVVFLYHAYEGSFVSRSASTGGLVLLGNVSTPKCMR